MGSYKVSQAPNRRTEKEREKKQDFSQNPEILLLVTDHFLFWRHYKIAPLAAGRQAKTLNNPLDSKLHVVLMNDFKFCILSPNIIIFVCEREIWSSL